uniref:Uncharacterized protein n=1 Tax=Amblyomma maculatum TaxID=34609 RepID=G3MTP0_AMBMU
MTVDLYFYPTSPQCAFVRIVAQRIGVQLRLHPLNPAARDEFQEKFAKVNPQRSLPMIDDDGLFLAESRAIGMYLVNKYAPDSTLYPKEPQRRAVVDRMLFFEMAFMQESARAALKDVIKRGSLTSERAQIVNNGLRMAIELLGSNKFLAGDELTLADIGLALSIGITMTGLGGEEVQHFKELEEYHDRVRKEVPEFDDHFALMWAALTETVAKSRLAIGKEGK